ncbi:MAG: hypothetical protein Q4A06_05505 [Cardiobacteriaceae bacterium]|nr:hypothetical protein [Cardiobacteriaceae bacterium]
MACDAAEKHYKKNGINRILLTTDGDFNVGVSDTEALYASGMFVLGFAST